MGTVPQNSFYNSPMCSLPSVRHRPRQHITCAAPSAAAATTTTTATTTSIAMPEQPRITPVLKNEDQGFDIVLSSGFLAFAAHAGFLQAVEDLGLGSRVMGVMGTSSGAITGSLYSAGFTPLQIFHELGKITPIERVAVSSEPWKGLLTLDPALRELKELLPSTFQELQRDFAVSVVGKNSVNELLDSGCLAEAVIASAAVPVLFQPVDIPNSQHGPYIDGGVACRIGLDLWREHRCSDKARPRPALIHLIGRSSPWSGNDSLDTIQDKNAAVVCSPKSGASLWDLNGYEAQFEAARQRALGVLAPIAAQQQTLEGV